MAVKQKLLHQNFCCDCEWKNDLFMSKAVHVLSLSYTFDDNGSYGRERNATMKNWKGKKTLVKFFNLLKMIGTFLIQDIWQLT